MNPVASNAPLDVATQSTPTRFTASTTTEIKRGTIFLTFTKPADAPDVNCARISVTLPRGDGDTDLVNDEERANFTLIDDYPRDSTGAEWTILRVPPAPAAAAPEWGEAAGHEFDNIFDPSDDRYYQTRGPVPMDTALIVDYGTPQEIYTIDIATGRPDARNKVQMLWLQSSMDGSTWWNVDDHPVQDTLSIERAFDPPLQARYLRIYTIVDPSNEAYAIVRRFLINYGRQQRSDDSTVTFICTPEDGPAVFDDSRQFRLILANIPINQAPGTASLTITETTIADNIPEEHTCVLGGFEKASTDFIFENFSSEQPCVENGADIMLHWTGSPENTTYYLSWDDRTEHISVPAATACSFSTGNLPGFTGLTHTTTFVLDAQTTTSHYQSTTVTVTDPDIEAKSFTAADQIAVTDDDTDTFQARSDDTTIWARTAVFNGNVTIT